MTLSLEGNMHSRTHLAQKLVTIIQNYLKDRAPQSFKIDFNVNGEKITMHVYNSTQRITIQGKKYKWFVDHYIEPFFKDLNNPYMA